jgi:hypothetical protein
MNFHSVYEIVKDILAVIGAGSVLATLGLVVFALLSHYRRD